MSCPQLKLADQSSTAHEPYNTYITFPLIKWFYLFDYQKNSLKFQLHLLFQIFNIICILIFFLYLFSLIKILQFNAGEGNQNMDENIKDDFEEEDDSDGSQKENTDSDDDWSFNI